MTEPVFEWTPNGLVYTRDQVEGALPNGTRVVKVKSDKGDRHALGALATVIGSMKNEESVIAYFVAWDDMPLVPVGVLGYKVAALTK